ncbi:MAG: hypothetical protein ABH815_02680 [Candidatus Omnitrophota bacterium]
MKGIKRVVASVIFIVFCFCNIAYPVDKKEEIRKYLEGINPILTNVDTAYRDISSKALSLEAGVKKMQVFISDLNSLIPPEFIRQQHKMILLSFKKLKMGYYLLSGKDISLARALVKRGGVLLKIAVGNILDLGRKEGIIKDENKSNQ